MAGARLQLTERDLDGILRGLPEGVLVLDAEGRIALANARSRELLGLLPNVEGQLPVEALRSAEIQDLLAQVARTAKEAKLDLEVDLPPRRTLRIHATPLAIGETAAVVAVLRDVTDALRIAAMRRDFVANASHELKTPLTAIRGFAETLLSADLSSEQARAQLRIVLAHSERLGLLVDDMLLLSEIEAGRRLEPVPVDVTSVARRVLANLEPRLLDRSLEARIVDPVPRICRADPSAVEEVLENLLDNAIKYTEAGGRIEVRIVPDGGMLAVEVVDSGIGIPEQHRDRVFERFYRVDRARSREQGGTGLGLAISKHLVQAMGGEISVESTPGVGSAFRFTLPT